jgi:hypothetical protein
MSTVVGDNLVWLALCKVGQQRPPAAARSPIPRTCERQSTSESLAFRPHKMMSRRGTSAAASSQVWDGRKRNDVTATCLRLCASHS